MAINPQVIECSSATYCKLLIDAKAQAKEAEWQRDTLLAAAEVGLHAVDGLIGMLAAGGEKDETLDTAKYLIEAAIAAAKSPAGHATGPRVERFAGVRNVRIYLL